MKIFILSMLMLFAGVAGTFGHGGKKHKRDSVSAQVDSAIHTQGDTVHHHADGMKSDQSKVTADLDDFPSLHPLVVHFAIVLIIVAAALQLVNMILMKNHLAWIIGVLLLVGSAAAWLASTNFHPHTHGISAHAKLVLEQHDKWADLTNVSARIGLVLQIVYLIFIAFKTRPNQSPENLPTHVTPRYARISSILIALVMLVSAYSVSRAGHYGAQLVHIEGIGPQGKFLEMDHHH